MTAFLLRRIALIVPTLFFVSVLIFGLQQLLPGDPALALAGENQDPAVIAYLHQKYHLESRAYCRAISASRSGSSGRFSILSAKNCR
jgi:ABC-type dipeptide/oligopeptide/nickel transport system permease component